MSQFELLHYASFSLVTETGGTWSLLFEGNIDGSPSAFLRHLLDTAGPAIDDIYRHCEGYPQGSPRGSEAALRDLLDHDIGAKAFYVAWPGQSVELISREDALRRHLQDFLDGLEPSRRRHVDPVDLHRLIVEEIRGNAGMNWALEDEPAPVLVRHARVVTALLATPLALTLLGVLASAAGHGRARRPARLALPVHYRINPSGG